MIQRNIYNGQQAGAADHTAQAQPTGQTYGTPTEPPEPGKPEKKKNKKTITIVVSVLVGCVVIAVTGIVLAATGVLSGDKEEKTDGTSTSQDSGSDTQTVSGGSVATKDDSGNLTVAGVAKKAMDSCVGITVYSKQNSYSNFYGYGSNSSSDSSDNQQASGEGSGVIMKEANGKTYIMTCAHVIADGSSFKVTLNNGKEYTATMVGADSQTDIGVLSIEATGLQAATFADSKSLTVGEQVVAIGCPGGLEFKNSVTSGYISALDRPVESSIGYDNECIQTDAAINPGNSGGALFNMQGQVIGINSSKIASTEYEGMGFAVPSSTAVDTANSLIKNGYVAGRAKIGVTYNTITSYNNADAILSALTEKGFKNAKGTMVINQVSSDSDLAGKQVKQYDMIVAVNGKTMTSTDVMTQVLSDSKPGDTIKLTIARIENNQIKYHDTREIFENGKVVGYTGSTRTLFEQQNQKTCYELLQDKIISREPLSIGLVRTVHRALTEGTYDERRYIVNGERPGDFKRHDYVTGRNEVGSPPDEVEDDLAELIDEINAIGQKAPLKAGAYFHARFENIHPFADGNGRVGRTLLNYWLMINDYPPMIIYEEDRRAYYDALQAYDEQEDLDLLTEFFEEQTVKTWTRSMELSDSDAPKSKGLGFFML